MPQAELLRWDTYHISSIENFDIVIWVLFWIKLFFLVIKNHNLKVIFVTINSVTILISNFYTDFT